MTGGVGVSVAGIAGTGAGRGNVATARDVGATNGVGVGGLATFGMKSAVAVAGSIAGAVAMLSGLCVPCGGTERVGVSTVDVAVTPAGRRSFSSSALGLGVIPVSAEAIARDVAENATCVSISCAMCVARMSGVAVGATAATVAVAVGVGSKPSPCCAPSHMRLTPSKTKIVTSILTVRTAEVRLLFSRCEIG